MNLTDEMETQVEYSIIVKEHSIAFEDLRGMGYDRVEVVLQLTRDLLGQLVNRVEDIKLFLVKVPLFIHLLG